MTLETLKAKFAEAVKARDEYLDRAKAANGGVAMLELLIKEEDARLKTETEDHPAKASAGERVGDGTDSNCKAE